MNSSQLPTINPSSPITSYAVIIPRAPRLPGQTLNEMTKGYEARMSSLTMTEIVVFMHARIKTSEARQAFELARKGMDQPQLVKLASMLLARARFQTMAKQATRLPV